jgi:helicase associated protein
MSTLALWLGDRDNIPNDFDGAVRKAQVIRRLRIMDGTEKTCDDRYLWLGVDPPFPVKDGTKTAEIAVLEAGGHTDLAALDKEPGGQNPWWTVHIAHVVDRSRIAAGIVMLSALSPQGSGQIARRPDLLPTSLQESFDQGFEVLQRFAKRKGHSAVPSDMVEDGFPLGVWLDNIRVLAAYGLTASMRRKLDALPGWTWTR